MKNMCSKNYTYTQVSCMKKVTLFRPHIFLIEMGVYNEGLIYRIR